MTKIKNGSFRETLRKSKNNYIMKNPIGDFKLRTNLPIESISFFYDFFSPENPHSSDPQMFDPRLLEIKYLQIHKREEKSGENAIWFLLKFRTRMFNLFSPATLSGFKPKLKSPQKGLFWPHSLADCVLKVECWLFSINSLITLNDLIDHLAKRVNAWKIAEFIPFNKQSSTQVVGFGGGRFRN